MAFCPVEMPSSGCHSGTSPVGTVLRRTAIVGTSSNSSIRMNTSGSAATSRSV